MDDVLVERRDRILSITITRPAARNAIDAVVTRGVAAAMDQLDDVPDLSIGILTGTGGTFCAGMDLKAFLRAEQVALPGRGLAGFTQAPPKKPLIAAVEGWVLGGGFELALACDLIVAAADARFGFPEGKRGLVAGEGGLIRLPRRLPYHLAMRVLLTGEPLSAAEAAEHGLVAELAAPGAALKKAHELAQRVAANAP